jgi:superfamily II DNA or RNA helicase
MPLDENEPLVNSREARALLERIDFPEGLRHLPPSVLARGRILFQTGGVQALSWEENGTVLRAELSGDEDRFRVQLKPQGHSSILAVNCTCPYAGNEGICQHAVAVLLTIQALQLGRYPRNRYAGPGFWESLEEQYFQGDSDQDESGDARPQGGPVILVDLDAPHAVDRYSYQPRAGERLSYWDNPPMEVEAFTNWRRVQTEQQDALFYDWLCRPSSIGIHVKLQGKVHPVEHHRPARLRGACELDLVDKTVVLRRRVWDEKTGDPVEPLAPLGEHLFFLKDRRFGLVEEEHFPELWQVGALYIRTWYRANSGGSLRVTTDAFGASLYVDVETWNEMNFPWPVSAAAKEAPPLKVKGLPAAAVVAEPVVTLNIGPAAKGFFSIRMSLSADGRPLLHGQEVLSLVQGEVSELPAGFARVSARVQALQEGLLRYLAARSDKERKQIAKELKANSAIIRIQDGPFITKSVLRRVERLYPLPLPASLHVEEDGEERWLVVQDGLRTAAQAGVIILHVLREGEITDEEDGYAFVVSEQVLAQGLPALASVCQQAGMGLTLEDRAIETIELDFKVRATRDAEQIDWFALAPEVVADGSVIPQEKWELWVKGGMIRDENGRLRVLSPQSAATLQTFSEILNLQRGEDGGKPRTSSAGLRVPRLRIFDWLTLRKAGVRCELPPEEAEVIEALTTFERVPEATLPNELNATLRPYQKEGYDWLQFLYRNRFGACLADDMGLGKTVQTIALLAAVKAEHAAAGNWRENEKTARKSHLVVLPPTLLFNWRHEIETFCPSLTVDELSGPQRDLEAIDSDVILTTYEVARRDIDILERREFEVIVFDEAQAIKNLTGERSKAMRRLRGRFKVCLTGTPLENHAGEYYSILELALPGLFGDYGRFMKSLSEESAFRPIDRARPFVLRRTKEKILDELPEKTESDVWLELTETQKRFYSRAVAEVREEVFKAFKDKTAQQAGIVALSALMRLRQICISPALVDPGHTEVSPKVEYLLETLAELADEGHSALIFSQFTRTLDLVERALQKQGIAFLRMDGTTPQAQRKVRVAAFQKGKGPAFFLISLKTGGVGLNLTRASYVFHLDPWWNPAVENQASDRAHRIGQTQRVFVNRLLMRHTVEEKMMLLKQRKQALFEQVLGGAENRGGGSLLTRDDMAWLLET